MKLKPIIILCAFISLIMVIPVYAHHLWAEKNGDTYSIARGMLDKRFDPYNPDKVKDFVAIGVDGSAIQKEKVQRIDEPEMARFRIADQVSMVAVTCDWGYRVNTTRGKKFLRRAEAEKEGFKVISAFFSTQYSKIFYEKGSGNTTPLGLKLEIVPLKDPSVIHEGDELPVQALFDGKPLANVVITGRAKEDVFTDNNGIGHFKITKKGKTLLMLGQKVPVKDDPEKDYHRYTTFIVFEVK